MARRVKSLKKNKKGIDPNHRDHRSKKGRRKIHRKDRLMAFKRKKERVKTQEMDNDLDDLL